MKRGCAGIGFDLLPEARDGVVHRSRGRRVRIAPDLAQQLVARDDAALVFGQVAEQFELAVRQVQLVAALQ